MRPPPSRCPSLRGAWPASGRLPWSVVQHGVVTSPSLPSWPATPPTSGRVELRAVSPADLRMAQELSTDPYVPKTGSLPARASEDEALAWVERQQRRHAERAGFSFTIVDASVDGAVGHCGLWLKDLGEGQATAGYAIVPSARGRGRRTHGAHRVRVDGAGRDPHLAPHRTLERGLRPHSRAGRICLRGHAAQASRDRGRTSGNVALRSRTAGNLNRGETGAPLWGDRIPERDVRERAPAAPSPLGVVMTRLSSTRACSGAHHPAIPPWGINALKRSRAATLGRWLQHRRNGVVRGSRSTTRRLRPRLASATRPTLRTTE